MTGGVEDGQHDSRSVDGTNDRKRSLILPVNARDQKDPHDVKADTQEGPKVEEVNMLAPSFPAANSPQRLGTTRNKVVLAPGHSLMDWIRLGQSGKDLQGFNGRTQPVTVDELAKHNKENDCWMLLRGRP